MPDFENCSPNQIIVFALGCAERAQQIFVEFADEHDEAPSESLKLGWAIQSDEFEGDVNDSVAELQQQLIDLIEPDETDTATMYSLESIHRALEAARTGNPEYAREAAECMTEAVENWAPSEDAGAAAQHGEIQWQQALYELVRSNPAIKRDDLDTLRSQRIPGRETDEDYKQAELFVIDTVTGQAKRLLHVDRDIVMLKQFTANHSIVLDESEALVAAFDYERVEIAELDNGTFVWRAL
ncbi:MAG: hypothetical protein AAGG48_32150 [Planctomycetota bacterium]